MAARKRSLTVIKPIPKKAMPVVMALRSDVARPKDLPVPSAGGVLRWVRTWPLGKSEISPVFPELSYAMCCPMGLLPTAATQCPISSDCFSPPITRKREIVGVQIFAEWWDSLRIEDAAEAIDLIWGAGA
jgi:hypothetical protein